MHVCIPTPSCYATQHLASSALQNKKQGTVESEQYKVVLDRKTLQGNTLRGLKSDCERDKVERKIVRETMKV